ncbi:hypothetical protein [Bradyrhizobium sp. Tv2a-2]|nr:hypothetical protein [Bradyrhizobium sp. Tv2a-2]
MERPTSEAAPLVCGSQIHTVQWLAEIANIEGLPVSGQFDQS